MIPTKTDVNITGTLPGEDVKMTLDSNSLAHLMSVLSNLYSNKGEAIVREYSTNAADSHVEAGTTKPIEVSTPTDFMPFLKIRDFGVGMDAETIRNVYSKYGASTKRGTNTQNGMLGLGSKSALTYTTQFNITGVKDGIKTYVVVSRSMDGSGSMKIISQSPTDEHNGVEISIPVSNKREIEQIAYNFFRFWKPGTVLLNGKDPAFIKGLQIGDFTLSDETKGVDYVVMGNVAYPVPQEHRIFKDYYAHVGVIANVKMGDVNFTPSREALHMTDLTKKTLVKLRNDFTAAVQKHLEEKVEKADSHSEAIKNHFEMRRSNLSSYVSNVKYQGKYIPDSFDFPWVYHVNSGTAQNAGYTQAYSIFDYKCLIIKGYDKEKIHSTHRAKLKMWLEEESIDVRFVYWCNEIPKAEWLEDIPTAHWDEINKMKLVRSKGSTVKSETFDVIDQRGYRISGKKADTSKTIVYASPTEVASQEAKDMVARFLTCDPNIQLLLVNKNKWKAFKTDYPQAVHLNEKVKAFVDGYFKNLSEEEKIYLRSNWKDRNFCARLDVTKVVDPKIKLAIKMLSTDGLSAKTEQQYERVVQVARHWNVTFVNLSGTGERLFDQYPLLSLYGHSSMDLPLNHVYLYMNAWYKENLLKNNQGKGN